MRWIKFIVYLTLTTIFVVFLSRPSGKIPFALGSFLSPFHGFWKNAVPETDIQSESLEFAGLTAPVKVVTDARRVPHIFAENQDDLAFAQGFVTARDRLWQMEFQIYAASGRLSEVLGPGPDNAILNYDREMRRKGLGWAAERAAAVIESNPEYNRLMSAYANGINAYIETLSPADYPIEYKLLHYEPEKWSILKTTYLFKFMANTLSGRAMDLQYTRALQLWGPEMMDLLYPERPQNEDPIIPVNHPWFFAPKPTPKIPAGYRPDSIPNLLTPAPAVSQIEHSPENPWQISPEEQPTADQILGSNNWAVHGQKTKSGKTLLASDPHLGFSLPATWYEIQLQAPGINVYGVSLPGGPGVIIGFNDSIAWGVTNAARDEFDYFQVTFEDTNYRRYKINNKWVEATKRVEKIKIKGSDTFVDTVTYTTLGPVMYDKNFGNVSVPLALRWMAHDPANDAETFLKLNKAQNYADYRDALKTFSTPPQNFVFASANGDIAISQQGKFTTRWKGQGKYIMDANNPEHHWQGVIPFLHNPYVLNPPRGFVSSANQQASLDYYPYYYRHNIYEAYRNRRLNWLLRTRDSLTIEDMKAFQLDNYGLMVEMVLPTLLSDLDTIPFTLVEKEAYRMLTKWDYYFEKDKVAPAIYQTWWKNLSDAIWTDEWEAAPGKLTLPGLEPMVSLLRDSATFVFYDNINTPEKEDRKMLVQASFQKALKDLAKKYGDMPEWHWYKINHVEMRHLLRVDNMKPFHRMEVPTSGGPHILNAVASRWGPSWRMVVELGGEEPLAYGIYPGGQTGNPGDPDYDAFIGDWAAGKYYKLWFMKNANDPRETGTVQETFLVGKKKEE